MGKRICIIGLNREVVDQIKQNFFGSVIHHDFIPKIIVSKGILYVERSKGPGMLPVDKVIFHGIFENDFDLITGLSIWGGDCFPNAFAMMNCRLKLPCLARALNVSNFSSQRGFISPDTTINSTDITVSKWGNWHCGENKHKFKGEWKSTEASVLEPFYEGDSVRIVSIGEVNLQIKLEGSSWLKSIHDESAHFMPINPVLLEDTLKIKKAFGMNMIANDYIVGTDGTIHLLEVNHIPNVDRFEKLRSIYIEEVVKWLND